jgi:hypothetical protein
MNQKVEFKTYYCSNLFYTQIVLSLQKEDKMLTKDKVNKTVNSLPESFTIDELIEQLIFIEKVEEGIKQSEEGKVFSNEDVKSMIDKWSK